MNIYKANLPHHILQSNLLAQQLLTIRYHQHTQIHHMTNTNNVFSMNCAQGDRQ
jgi:hypothetical protein